MIDDRLFDNLKAVEKMLSSCKSYVKKVRTGTQRKGLMTTDWNHFLSTQMTKVQETLAKIQGSILGKDPRTLEQPTTNGHGVTQLNEVSLRTEETAMYQQQLRSLRSQLILSEEKCNELNEKLQRMTTENMELLGRLNGQLNNNNNLSGAVLIDDETMSSQLSDRFRQLHDGEWTESLQKLATHMPEKDAIHKLLLIIKNSYQLCEKTAYQWKVWLARSTLSLTDLTRETQAQLAHSQNSMTPELQRRSTDSASPTETKDGRHVSRISVGVTITGVRSPAVRRPLSSTSQMVMPSLEPDCDQIINQLRKSAGKNLQQQVQKIVFAEMQDVISQDTLAYAEKCTELCWSMCLQVPPVVFNYNMAKGDTLDCDNFSPYTDIGDSPDFLVWPAMLQHDDGSILSKGYVQCKL
ncbi:hypothetical protein ScPMuIL_010664 [Solemya velum]